MYQTIKNPNIKKKIPILLNFVSGTFSITLSIFLILVGKMAKNNPSIKRSNPRAEIKSFIKTSYGLLVNPALPKNLKKSLSGERIREVSPPIKAVS